MKTGKVFVISGPSGVGKGTICNVLMREHPELAATTVSVTTRAPRPGEKDGVHYYFRSDREFDEMLEKGMFLETVDKFTHRYGTLYSEVERVLQTGKNVILEIEMVGGHAVKKRIPESVLIFILPPSLEDLTSRIVGRGSETEEQIAVRQAQVEEEFDQSAGYEYFVVNDDLAEAVEKIRSIIIAEGLKGNGEEIKENYFGRK
ncbi:MAG: guanylate kinase [Clostridia bacterium]|nr:guanylate kinase [Clostridia bacterium]